MKSYVCGFLFNEEKTHVVLIHKTKGPPNVIGKLNGIGGKIEPGEHSLQAMYREFLEETGLDIPHSKWKNFATLTDSDSMWEVFFYKAFIDIETFYRAKTIEDEMIVFTHLFNLNQRDDIVENLAYLVPMALDPNHSFAHIIEK